MNTIEQKLHWEKVYSGKETKECSWYQSIPEISLKYIKKLNLAHDANLIDVGGGESFLVDNLISEGFKNITVLDISEIALERKKISLKESAKKINWINSNILEFTPAKKFDLWHDRATFHFLTSKDEIDIYFALLKKYLFPGGDLILGTFSEKGPEKCSGIAIKQYSQEEMINLFKQDFEMIHCENVDHETPNSKIQNFTFCHFKKK